MKTLIIIPARYDAQRFPGKLLEDLSGESVLQRTLTRLRALTFECDLIVATDDLRIYRHVQGLGYDAEITNRNHPSGTDRCAEIAYRHSHYELYINVQGDEPFVDTDAVNALQKMMSENTSRPIGTLMSPITDESRMTNPNRVKVVCNQQNRCLYFSRSQIPYPRSESKAVYHEHIGVYAFRSSILRDISDLSPTPLELAEGLEQLRWIEHGMDIYAVESTSRHLSIDSPEDLESAKLWLLSSQEATVKK